MRCNLYRHELLLFFLALLGGPLGTVSAQTESKVYRLKGVDHANETVPYNERFQFEQFRKGLVYLASGGVSESTLNYNLLFNEIQFLGHNNDTLSIYDNNQVKFVSVGNDLFFHSDAYGYMQLAGEYKAIKLARKRGMVPVGTEKTIGYGTYASNSATDSYHSYISATGQLNKLEKKNVLILRTNRISFFLIDANGKFYPAGKNAILKIYSKDREPVLQYLKMHDVNFEKETDLKELLSFAANLNNDMHDDQ
jgi:hypothetical protein